VFDLHVGPRGTVPATAANGVPKLAPTSSTRVLSTSGRDSR
jgi:hypothetical protein